MSGWAMYVLYSKATKPYSTGCHVHTADVLRCPYCIALAMCADNDISAGFEDNEIRDT